jgi:hypothetical protein
LKFSRPRRRFKPATLKAVFALNNLRRCTRHKTNEPPATFAALSCAHLFKLRSGESRGRDGREACQGGYLSHNI